jgi:hypothetical protein
MIETQWQENPKVTFDQTLNTEFKFGVFGFMDVVEKTTSVLSKSITVGVATFKRLFGLRFC